MVWCAYASAIRPGISGKPDADKSSIRQALSHRPVRVAS